MGTAGAEGFSLLTRCETQTVGMCPALGQARSSATGCSAFPSLATLHCKAASTPCRESSPLPTALALASPGAQAPKHRARQTPNLPLHVLPAPGLSPTRPQRNSDGTGTSYEPSFAAEGGCDRGGPRAGPCRSRGAAAVLPLPWHVSPPAAPGPRQDPRGLISIRAQIAGLTAPEERPSGKAQQSWLS